METASYLQKIPILDEMDTITLPEMKGIQLMNRIDTKYMANVDFLPALLYKAKNHYRVQIVKNTPIGQYQTLYYDTKDIQMYTVHHNRILTRQKIRARTYLNSQISFLEIKNKNNKGRTKKERISIDPFEVLDFSQNLSAVDFLDQKSRYPYSELMPQVQNSFDRITLVNNEKTERLTIDFNLCFRNYQTGVLKEMPSLMIIELKQDGLCHSLFKDFLTDLRVKPISISKYCLGTILTNEQAKSNRFKKKMMIINKICTQSSFI